MTTPSPLMLDVRPILTAGGEPFAEIMTAVASLAPGQALCTYGAPGYAYQPGYYGPAYDPWWYGPSFGNDQFMSLWIFVGQDHFRDRNFRNYAVPQRNYGSFFSQTTNTTNYVTINNYVVNRSVDRGRLERATNQRLEQVPARSVIGPKTIVTQVGEGRQVEQRERQRRPIPASIDRSDQRGRDNLNTNAQEQKANQPQPRVQDRDNDRGRDEPDSKARVQSNPQTDRDPRVTNTRPPNSRAAGQGLAERRNRDAEVPTIQVTPS